LQRKSGVLKDLYWNTGVDRAIRDTQAMCVFDTRHITKKLEWITA